jgi:hypothetical protein
MFPPVVETTLDERIASAQKAAVLQIELAARFYASGSDEIDWPFRACSNMGT